MDKKESKGKMDFQIHLIGGQMETLWQVIVPMLIGKYLNQLNIIQYKELKYQMKI